MARTNTPTMNRAKTHEGAPARAPKNALHELERAVTSCLLWEDNFYESGEDVATRIHRLAGEAPADEVAALAITARHDLNLRHAPLWLLASLAQHGKGATADVYERVISRADEPGELISLFWKGGKRPLPGQMKRGIGLAMRKFDEYALAKYDRKVAIRLRDVIRLTHPKPTDEAQSDLWKRAIAGELKTPDTWEVALSGGADKKETFERLLREGKLGYLALLRNLRNMDEAGVDRGLVNQTLTTHKGARKVLPWQFLTAARYAPVFEGAIDAALSGVIDETELPGSTVVCIDTSASMGQRLSDKSVATRLDAAAVIGCCVRGDVRILQFASKVQELPFRRGLVGADMLRQNVGKVGHGTMIGDAVRRAMTYSPSRIVVVSDMQSMNACPQTPKGVTGYAVNVAPYQNHVAFEGNWTEVNGFSPNLVRFIREAEGL